LFDFQAALRKVKRLHRPRLCGAGANIGGSHIAQSGNRNCDDDHDQYRHYQQETARALDLQLGLSHQKFLGLTVPR
jgi:hypothetical protein